MPTSLGTCPQKWWKSRDYRKEAQCGTRAVRTHQWGVNCKEEVYSDPEWYRAMADFLIFFCAIP